MTFFLINIILAFAWCALTGKFIFSNFFLGYLLGLSIITLTTWRQNGRYYLRKTYLIILFILYIIWELIISTLRVAYAVFAPLSHCKPGVVAISLTCKTSLEITFLANLISLTPGTLALDISSNQKTIYVHGMFITNPEKFRQEIKQNLEQRVLEILK